MVKSACLLCDAARYEQQIALLIVLKYTPRSEIKTVYAAVLRYIYIHQRRVIHLVLCCVVNRLVVAEIQFPVCENVLACRVELLDYIR